ncbi:aminotransferase class I/II-fold pyridoxal phosphate-dependent enzyme [Niabella sp. CC-SYL272]|uniref:pyridoxal phosphate-dependent aminotransferase n=1 Tax=Niabella agricola TaxID=2891571 RepID=UPI001F352B1A|nr:aminotransferase class I/II-fold pyridoxal phosphate-dependent enzyme [Niabella agricola]MCF3108365.1 aminotransferase class I/II-fold pyridoxal phosphate-dependent enzyme [Niabella agricola]
MKLSRLAENTPPSGILAISNAVKKRAAAGERLLNYTVGDFDPWLFPIPKLLEDEIVRAYRNRQTNYPATDGNEDLRAAIAAFIKQQQGLSYTPQEFMIGSGGRPLLFAAYQMIVDPGDTVIYPVPSWNNHFYVQLTGALPCIVETKPEHNFMPTVDEIRPFIKDAVLLALCSPQNPTGTCFSEPQLKSICDMVVNENARRGAGEKKLYILYDQMYYLLNYGRQAHVSPVSVCPEVQPYTIYIDAISKAFAATGVRVGWCYGPEPVISKIKTMLNHVGAWAPMAEQKAVAAFLDNHTEVVAYLTGFKEALLLRLTKIYKGLLEMKKKGLPVDAIAPAASIYLSVKIALPQDMTTLLLEEAGIALLPFSVFGAAHARNWYRLSVGTCRMEDIEPMLGSLQKVLELYTEPVQRTGQH